MTRFPRPFLLMVGAILLFLVGVLLGAATVSPGDVRDMARPDPRLTPGVVRTTDRHLVCRTGSSRAARNVTPELSHRVYARYHATKKSGVCCEVDHLVPLELGGSNDIKNLWPQPWAEARIKDELENRAHLLVCDRTMALTDAQQKIAEDWVEFYRLVFGHAPRGGST